jgi:hypothetical protein
LRLPPSTRHEQAAGSSARSGAPPPHLDDDRYFHPDLEKAIALVSSGAIVETVGRDLLPAVEGRTPS